MYRIRNDLLFCSTSLFLISVFLMPSNAYATTPSLFLSKKQKTAPGTHRQHTHSLPQAQPEAITVSSSATSRAQATPASISHFSGQQLREMGVRQPKDIALFVPGVTAINATSGSTPIFTIRGIGLEDYTGSNSGGVGIYLDGVYLPYGVFYSGDLVDIAGVNVLKGPQGFSEGRSSTGGSIFFSSALPTNKFSGGLDWGYGSYSTNTARGYVNVPFSDKVKGRLSFQYTNGDGWQQDVTTSNRYAGQDDLGIKNVYVADFSDKISMTFGINYHRNYGTPSSPQNTTADATWGVATGTYGVATNSRYNKVNVGSLPVHRQENGGGFFDKINAQFKNFTLTNIFGINAYHRNIIDNFDGENGAFNDSKTNDTYFSESDDLSVSLTSIKFSKIKLGVFQSYDQVRGDYANDQMASFGTNLAAKFFQKNASIGPYFSTMTDVGHNTQIILSGHYTHDIRSYDGGTMDLAGTYVAPGSYMYKLNKTNQYDKFTGKFGIKHNFTKDFFAYATISNGFKSGAFFSQSSSSSSSIAYVKPESLLAYEVGIKYQTPDTAFTVSGALFDYEYRNRQTLMLALAPNDAAFVSLGSIPKARTRGGELESSWVTPLKGLRLWASFSYLDAIILKAPSSLRGSPLLLPITTHSALPFSPKFSMAAGLSYTRDISKKLTLHSTANYMWKDKMWASLGDANAQSSVIQTLGLRLSLSSRSKTPWHVDFYIDNLTDRHGWAYSFTTPDNSRAQYIQTPRWYGFEIGQKF